MAGEGDAIDFINNINCMRCLKYKGFSLIELFVALLLGSVLMVGVGRLYLMMKRNFTLQQRFFSLQESERFIRYFLTQKIRMAGYSGCDSASNWVQANAIRGYVVKGNDVIEVYECMRDKQQERFWPAEFFVVKTAQKTALYMKKQGRRREELLPDVQNMSVHYGVDHNRDGDIDGYLKASQVRNWGDVKIVDVRLLFKNHLLKKKVFSFRVALRER